jgi:hypothetical protein
MASWRTAHNRARQRPYSGGRKRKAIKRWLKTVTKAVAVHLDCPDRPWFRLEMKGIR